MIALATLAATLAVALSLSSELLPEVHQGEFTVEVALPVGTPLERTEEILGPVEAAILAEVEHIEALIVTFGFDPATSQRSDEGEHSARVKLMLESSDPRGEAEGRARIRSRHPGSGAEVRRMGPDQVEVRFDDPQDAVTPGQSAVFYDGDRVLGGGVIQAAITCRQGMEEGSAAAD